MEEYLSKLNEPQRKAVMYVDGPELVIAGAGSGKTRVLTHKIVHLLKSGIPPYRIMALTFTNKAAREMKERMQQFDSNLHVEQLWMGTFHSIFLKILHVNCERIGFNNNFTIYDSSDSKSLIKTVIKQLELDEKMYRPSSIQSTISRLKNALISPSKYASDERMMQEDTRAKIPEFYRIYSEYWRRCKLANAMDFDDILFYTNILLRDNPDVLEKYQDYFQYVLVDEYQDTNFSQHLIVKQLCDKSHKLCVVGDDAQSIYSFRGANIDNILNLNVQYPDLKIFKLEQNYRSTQSIINAANSLIAHNKSQIRKEIFSEKAVGQPITVIESYSGYEESYAIANKIVELNRSHNISYDDFAILYRTNAQSRLFEESLRKRNIPYRIYGGVSFYQRKEVKDIVSYLRLSVNPDDDEALRRIINVPARGIGDTTLRKLQTYASEHNVSIWRSLSDQHISQVDINNGTRNKLIKFRELVDTTINSNLSGKDAEYVTREIIKSTGIITILASEATPENISRQENIAELVSDVANFVTSHKEEGDENVSVTDFLSEISLATDQDSDNNNDNSPRVTLMTVHAAKGLEFRAVFIVGLEEELFPAAMSSSSVRGIEEERRLMYVAITRAEDVCVISHANSRFINGQTKLCSPSRFLREIDPKYLTGQTKSITQQKEGAAKSDYGFSSVWNRQSYNSSITSNYQSKTVQQKSIQSSSQSTKPNATGNADIHTASELSVGMTIQHSRFGEGKILKIDSDNSGQKIEVSFNEFGEKTLLLKFARFNIVK